MLELGIELDVEELIEKVECSWTNFVDAERVATLVGPLALGRTRFQIEPSR
ncbi:hypothetical protein AB0I30_17670 [Nocardia tengchongensis]|uniref:hypothetical protein n=1 Tax=Nocardia tengchongensis TaxID=2055889 RepID=UPI0033DFEDC0